MSTTTTALDAPMNAAHENIDRTMAGLKDGIAGATAGMEQAQASMRDTMQKFMKTAEDMYSFAQGNVEAMARSGQILATAMQDIGQTVAATTRAQMDETVSTFKAMSTVKSVREAVELQTALVRNTIEKAVAQTTQLTDSSAKLSEQVMAPIAARITAATEKFGRVG